MIQAFFVVNLSGKLRLCKFYQEILGFFYFFNKKYSIFHRGSKTNTYSRLLFKDIKYIGKWMSIF